MPSANYAFTVLDSVDSTNNYAMAKVHAGMAKHGDAFFSFEQTGGKGQRGKTWLTGKAENIAISIIIEPKPLQVAQQFTLSALVALACYDFFSSYAGDETAIKWPNDIYWRDRKAGGILIENVIGKTRPVENGKHAAANGWKYAVAGIGINVNQVLFDAALQNAVSLRQITGKVFDVLELAKQLHQLVMKRTVLLQTQGTAAIVKAYNDCLYKRNNSVTLRKGTIEFSTTIKGVTEEGRLFTTDLIDNYFDFGEVDWML